MAAWQIKHGGAVHHATRAKASLGIIISILFQQALFHPMFGQQLPIVFLPSQLPLPRCYSVREMVRVGPLFFAVFVVDPGEQVMVIWKSVVTRSLSLNKQPLGRIVCNSS